MAALNDFLEGSHRVTHLDKRTGAPGELLGNVERLGQELLYSSGTGHRHLLVLGELLHA